MLKFAILGFLSYTPMTGYDIKQRMDRSTSHFWHAKQSQIYTTLKCLEQEGCIESHVEEQTDRPDKRIYTLTPEGRRQLKTWLEEPYTECSPRKETLVLKMFFAAQMDPQSAISQLRIQRDVHAKQLAYYRTDTVRSIQQAEEEFPALKQDAIMWEATRRFGEMYEDVYIQWIDEMIQQLSSNRETESR
jgi:PadR family transcriptional regulator, regulatory protein AphA